MATDRRKAAASTPPSRGSKGRFSRSVALERVAEAKRLYEGSTLSAAAIAQQVGIGRATVQRHAKLGGWTRADAAEERRRLVGSIRQKAEREIVAASRALKAGGDPGPAARTLASLVRTLRELAKYDEEQARSSGRSGSAEDGDFNDFVADPDAFREALADRLEQLRDEREA